MASKSLFCHCYPSETGWYYLQSRYYDPIVKRFLNADAYASTGQGFLGHNMFSYCTNSPGLHQDDGGNIMQNTNTQMTDAPGAHDPSHHSSYYIPINSPSYNRVYEYIKEAAEFVGNDDPEKCFGSFFSMYRGAPVFNVKSNLLKKLEICPFSFGFIYLINVDDYTDPTDVLNHEHGHIYQFWLMGPWRYIRKVVIPSATFNVLSRSNSYLDDNYYSMPWERFPDWIENITGGDHDHSLDPTGIQSLLYTLLP